ncbi:hypothetical protein [Roseimicrobium sp. ORNL1]|uniref:hypothetical protein n=1 Tax=Roseimicrobium sp. ORNL1 TaxID=2711231 RepID=UPI0013E1ADBF|nr:hypothetical protein [Roseimicrobium sp. ORNL1]QIF01754.1 hypothetical protein G5S37_09530 [Roseimicrobium sp. ORNL1]
MKTLFSFLLACLMFSGCLCPSLLALDDGIYLLKQGPSDSEIRLVGGYSGAIDRRLSTNEYNIRVESRNNWNDSFSIFLEINRDFSVETSSDLAIALDGQLYAPIGMEHEWLKTLSGEAKNVLIDEKLATRIAGVGRVTARLRKHPGHKLAIRFACKSNAWKVRAAQKEGAELEVLLQIKNLGEQSVFLPQESEGPARSSCLSLVPREEWAPFCRDVRGESQKVTFCSTVELQPGQSMTVRKENLLNWYRPTIQGRFVFLGTYELPIYERMESKKPIWVEQVSGAFEVTFEE